MPQYFFHIFNDDIVMDEEGQELADLEAAREVALDSARDLVCESVQHGHLNLDHRIEVEDDKGETLLVLTFRDAFTIQN
ncbi:MAG: hypothetical protein JWP15_896 [Alphaproteobacteria bacterium]|nr:hypothetical protein [Alphaproteobacteria bacterium]